METMKISCPNCGHDAGQLTYEAPRQRILPPLPSKPNLRGSDPEIFGSWTSDEGRELGGEWHRPKDLHKAFSMWWVTEGGAPFKVPGPRRMSVALIALGWTWKNTSTGRVYTPPDRS